MCQGIHAVVDHRVSGHRPCWHACATCARHVGLADQNGCNILSGMHVPGFLMIFEHKIS